ncbi:MAG: hypothetical protein QW231_04520, partial [Candidatus Bathyarchaeia archaeon]
LASSPGERGPYGVIKMLKIVSTVKHTRPDMRRLSTKNLALVGVFAAFHVILYFMSPPALWRNWAIYLEPIEGIVLGPWAGFSAALIGSIVARMIKPIDVWMFGIVAEPMGVLVSGLLAKGRWKPAVAIYAFMLTAYFVHPFGRWLPLWTILDILIAFALIYPVAKMGKGLFEEDVKRLPLSLILLSFIGTVTDALTRVFLLIPAGLYILLGWPLEDVYLVFVFGAIDSYIEDGLVVLVSFLVGAPLLVALRRIPGLKYPIT